MAIDLVLAVGKHRLFQGGEDVTDEQITGAAKNNDWLTLSALLFEQGDPHIHNWFNTLFQISMAPDHMWGGIATLIIKSTKDQELSLALLEASGKRLASYGKPLGIRAFLLSTMEAKGPELSEKIAVTMLLNSLAYSQLECMNACLDFCPDDPLSGMDPFTTLTPFATMIATKKGAPDQRLSKALEICMSLSSPPSDPHLCIDAAINAGLSLEGQMLSELKERLNYEKERAIAIFEAKHIGKTTGALKATSNRRASI